MLARICEGLELPRELMGLSFYGPTGAYAGDVTVAELPEGVDARMHRRALITAGAVAAFGRPVLGKLVTLPGPVCSVALPDRLDWHHVANVRDLTRRLGEADHGRICDPDVCSAAATRAARLLDVAGAAPVRRALLTSVAELHFEAGRSAHDALLYERSMHHLGRALDMATEAGDHYCQVLVLNYAGLATIEHGAPDDGLKLLQLGQVTSWRIPRDDRHAVVVGESGRVALEACALADSATALAALGHTDLAAAELRKSRELWQPTRNDTFGNPDRVAALFELGRGRLDIAEQHAAAAVRRWDGINTDRRTSSVIVLATVHVQACEPSGLGMAKSAIDATAQLDSPRTRRQLSPLADALAAQPGSDAREDGTDGRLDQGGIAADTSGKNGHGVRVFGQQVGHCKR